MYRTLILLAIFCRLALLTAQTEVVIGTGSGTNLYFPAATYYVYSRSASLYDASEIGISGVVQKLAWNVDETGITTPVAAKIYLKTTAVTALAPATWQSMIEGATMVYEGNFADLEAGWNSIDIADYTYTDQNLLVLVETNDTYQAVPKFWFSASLANGFHQSWEDDDAAPTGNGSLTASRPDIRLTIQEGSGIDLSEYNKSQLLLNNYPNPFNPATTISYHLSGMSDVQLAVYDAKGELVKTLVKGMQNAGIHSVSFDGAGLNSGIYFYKLITPEQTTTNRMLMIK